MSLQCLEQLARQKGQSHLHKAPAASYIHPSFSEIMSAPSVSVNNLFTAIAQAFAIIFLGYVFGRFKIIPPSEGKAIGTLVAKLALPALLFRNLAVLELSEISWPFMAAILIAKLLIFLAVGLVTILVTRPFNIGKAAIFGIFASQSNDFALGLPIGKPFVDLHVHALLFFCCYNGL